MDAQWSTLTPDEKFEARFATYAAAEGVNFATPEAEKTYKERVQAIKDVVQLKKPARIPILLNIGFFPFAYAGVTVKDATYNYERLGYALKKYHTDFQPDNLASALIYGSGKLFEILDYKLYHWAGHGVSDTSPYQCIEGEYMTADEYDDFLIDPSNFFMRKYLPRVFGALEPWTMMSPFTDILELPFLGGFMVPVSLPPVRESFKKLIEASEATEEWFQACLAIDQASITQYGIVPFTGGFTKAPFDILGDTLRGTRPIMLDMFRRPKKLLAALDHLVPMATEMAVRSSTVNKNPIVFIPLHKGADGFMSDKDFKTFYWPSLKAVLQGIIAEGCVPYLFAEGGYNSRLDDIVDDDLPAGKMIWFFDQTDMVEVKKRFSGYSAFAGNVPASLLKAGTPQQVEDCVKSLIDTVGQDGGYALSNGAVMDDAEPENLHALFRAGREYGKN